MAVQETEIRINEYVKVLVKIPSKMDVAIFKAITDLVNKLFRLSMNELEGTMGTSDSKKSPKSSNTSNTNGNKSGILDDIVAMKDRQKKSYDEIKIAINKKYSTDYSKKQIREKYGGYRFRHGLTKKRRQNGKD